MDNLPDIYRMLLAAAKIGLLIIAAALFVAASVLYALLEEEEV